METEVRRRVVRHQLIGMALRRAKPDTGSSRAFLQRRTWYRPEVGVLAQLDFSMLPVPVVIVGGIATALYMPQRVTFDLDLLVHADDFAALGEALVQQGFRRDSA